MFMVLTVLFVFTATAKVHSDHYMQNSAQTVIDPCKFGPNRLNIQNGKFA